MSDFQVRKQALFEKVASYMMKQGRLSSTFNGFIGSCLYRGPNETKCPAGALIKDEYYCTGLEYKSADTNLVKTALLHSGVYPDELRLVHQLQKLHDNADTFSDFVNSIIEFGVEQKLQLPNCLCL
jgi:hypothetical protein